MSNILIIKHGSLGDIVQISGILRDIRENFKESKIFILTTPPYHNLLKQCPYVNDILIDQRKPRWNIFYLFNLLQNQFFLITQNDIDFFCSVSFQILY